MASRTMKSKKKMNVYNGAGSPQVAAAEDETPGFKKGGVAKKKRDHEKLADGGMAEGGMAKHRMDKKSRGGHHKRASGGRTPYSSGSNTSAPSESGKTESGHEGQRPG